MYPGYQAERKTKASEEKGRGVSERKAAKIGGAVKHWEELQITERGSWWDEKALQRDRDELAARTKKAKEKVDEIKRQKAKGEADPAPDDEESQVHWGNRTKYEILIGKKVVNVYRSDYHLESLGLLV